MLLRHSHVSKPLHRSHNDLRLSATGKNRSKTKPERSGNAILLLSFSGLQNHLLMESANQLSAWLPHANLLLRNIPLLHTNLRSPRAISTLQPIKQQWKSNLSRSDMDVSILILNTEVSNSSHYTSFHGMDEQWSDSSFMHGTLFEGNVYYNFQQTNQKKDSRLKTSTTYALSLLRSRASWRGKQLQPWSSPSRSHSASGSYR